MKTKTTKHTAGPWTAYNSDHGRIFKQWRINAGTFHKVATISPREIVAEEYANARLIAAAPQLLEALQVCSGQLESVQLQTEEPLAMPWPSIEQARAAIAAATGE